MPYNPLTELFYQSPDTLVDPTPGGDSVRVGFENRNSPAIAQLYNDLNLLKTDGMIVPGIVATEQWRGISRIATWAEVRDGVTGPLGPAFITPELLRYSIDSMNDTVPRIISPDYDQTIYAQSASVTISPMFLLGKEIAGKQIQLSPYANFSALAWDSGTLPYTLESVIAAELQYGGEYYVRVRLVLEDGDEFTDWSAAVRFRVSALAVNQEFSYANVGTSEFAAPEAGTYQVTVTGAGGGTYAQVQNYCFPAGGSGGRAVSRLHFEKGEKYPVIVGTGGSSSWSFGCSTGGTGGSSSFGSLLTATGGTGGSACNGGCVNGSPGIAVGGNAENITGGGATGGASGIASAAYGAGGWVKIVFLGE